MSLIRILALSFIALILIPISAVAGVREYMLDNGLKVLIIEDHKVPLATFQIWYRIGSREETSGKTGLSHLLEHMMFKGTPRYGSKVFSKIIQRNGGVDNAMTSRDYTMYFQTMSSDRIGLSVELESDRMTNLILDEKEVLSERNVVKEERRMRYDNDPQNALFETLMANAFMAHPYRRPVIGWMQDISEIRRDDLYKHYKAYYSPNNAFIVIAGDVDPDEILKKIKTGFGGINKTILPDRNITEEPEQSGEKRFYLKKEAEISSVIMGHHTPRFPHEDSFALDVLSSILSGGKSSRLYRSLVYDKKIALEAGADYDGMHIDPLLFFFWVNAAPEKDINEAEKSLLSEISTIKDTPPTEREVQKAKNQIEASFIFSQDSLYRQAMNIGRFEILGGWRLMEDYLDGIRKVTPADVRRVAQKYLTEDNRTVGVLVPVKNSK